MCLEGDSVAWETLVNRYRKLIYHFPSQERINSDLADEVFQETCLALYKQLPKINQTEDLSFWIANVAQRITWKTINASRKSQGEAISEIYDIESPDKIPEENLITKLNQHHIRRALLSMKEKCKNLLFMLFFSDDESDYKKIANTLGIPIGSIGPTRNRCLDKLRKILISNGLNIGEISCIKSQKKSTYRTDEETRDDDK